TVIKRKSLIVFAMLSCRPSEGPERIDIVRIYFQGMLELAPGVLPAMDGGQQNGEIPTQLSPMGLMRDRLSVMRNRVIVASDPNQDFTHQRVCRFVLRIPRQRFFEFFQGLWNLAVVFIR